MLENHRLIPIIAFLTGIALTLGFKDVYPDLERRFRRRRKENNSHNLGYEAHIGERLQITDDVVELDQSNVTNSIPEGIESCIGNTPLFKIKSLSEATGCEILAKAEVCIYRLFIAQF
jgi:cysteine synthase